MDDKKIIEHLEKLCLELGYRIYPIRGMAIVPWNVEDVQKRRPDLTRDEADEVLGFMESEFDASVGMNWNSLEEAANNLFPLEDYEDKGGYDIIYKTKDDEYRLAHVYCAAGEYENGNWRSNIYEHCFSKEEILDYEKRNEITEDSKMYCEEHMDIEEALKCCHENIINADEYFNLHSIRKYKNTTIETAVEMLDDCKIGYAVMEV